MKAVRSLLRIVTDRFPPPEGRKHGITLSDDRESLVLAIARPDDWQTFLLDAEDLARDPAVVAHDVIALAADGASR